MTGSLLAVLALLILFPSLLRAQEAQQQQQHHQRHRHLPSPILSALPLPTEQREYELVVLRYNEDIHPWVDQIPGFWMVTILNKGQPIAVPSRQNTEFFDCPQSNENGREGELIAAYIYQRYHTLAEYTAFCQGDPLEHNPEFITLLKQRSLLNSVQPFSYIYKPGVTNAHVIEMHKRHPLFRSEIFSLRTLDTVYFRDDYIWLVAQWLAENFSVPVGTNLVSHYLGTVGLPGWVPQDQEIGAFAYGAMMGIHKTKILQHRRSVYARISSSVNGFRWTVVLLERTWLMLFGGPNYRDP